MSRALTDMDMTVLQLIADEDSYWVKSSTVRKKVDGVDSTGSSTYRFNKLEEQNAIKSEYLLEDDSPQKKRVAAVTDTGLALLKDFDSGEATTSSEDALDALTKRIEALERENEEQKKKLEELDNSTEYAMDAVEEIAGETDTNLSELMFRYFT